MDYIREAIETLKEYNSLVASIKNIREQLMALEADKHNIKAQQMSFAPGGSGANEPNEQTCNNIFRRQCLTRSYSATKKRIECIERSLELLDEEEKKVISRVFIVGGKRAIDDLSEELGYCQRQVYRVKNTALRKFSKAMFGIGTV